jgi:hypothetical protein
MNEASIDHPQQHRRLSSPITHPYESVAEEAGIGRRGVTPPVAALRGPAHLADHERHALEGPALQRVHRESHGVVLRVEELLEGEGCVSHETIEKTVRHIGITA